MYNSAISFNAAKKDLRLCHDTAGKLIDTGLLYNDCFSLASVLKPEARQSTMSTSELRDLLKVKRQEAQRIKLKNYAGAGKIGISVQSEITGEVVVFPSHTAAFDYLRSKGVNIASKTLSREWKSVQRFYISKSLNTLHTHPCLFFIFILTFGFSSSSSIIIAIIINNSFGVPALAIKCDAYPGRLNAVSVLINREGVFYGRKLAYMY